MEDKYNRKGKSRFEGKVDFVVRKWSYGGKSKTVSF